MSEEQYTLYHPAEVELGETIRRPAARSSSGCGRRASSSTRCSEMRLLARDPLRYRRQILALKHVLRRPATCTVLLLDDLTAGGDDSQLQSLCPRRPAARAAAVRLRAGPAAAAHRQVPRRRRPPRASTTSPSAAAASRVFPQIAPPRAGHGRPRRRSRAASPSSTRCSAAAWPGARRTLFIGPSGSGKSTLATQYVAADARAPARGLPVRRAHADLRRALRRAGHAAVGADRAAAGSASQQIEPGELSPGEFSHRVRDDVERRGARDGPHRQHQRLPARHPAERRAAGADARAAVVPERARRRDDAGAGAARHHRHDDDARRSTSAISPTP